MTNVKICGITRLEDATWAAECGAYALGFNFFIESPRYLTPIAAREICREMHGPVLKVGVFVNSSVADVLEAAEGAGLDVIQLHGDETPEYVSALRARTNIKLMKAFRVSESVDIQFMRKFDVDASVLDVRSTMGYGGTGEVFDWNIARNAAAEISNLYLAGGLCPENVAEAISIVRPFAVDVASGVESAQGIKDPERVKRFIEAVRSTI